MRNCTQNNKLEQWVMHRVVEDDVLGFILSCHIPKFFFLVCKSLLYNSSIPICLIINQFTIHSRNPFNKAYTDETVKNSKFRRIDVFNKNIVT